MDICIGEVNARHKESHVYHAKKMGHFAKVCRSRPVNEVTTDAMDTDHRSQAESTTVDERMADLFVSTINNDQQENNELWFTVFNVNGEPVKFKMDTGS